jgi:hypothetical protein
MSADSFTVLLLLAGGFVWVVAIAVVFLLLHRAETAKRDARQGEREAEAQRWSL